MRAILQKFVFRYIALAGLFLAHRVICWQYLINSDQRAVLTSAKYFLVGSWSDLWVAFLGATIATIFFVVVSLFKREKPSAPSLLLALAFYIPMIALLALHQSYVEFFRFPFVTAHFEYFHDRHFLAANSRSLLSWGPLLFAAVALVLLAVMAMVLRRWRSGLVASSSIAFGIAVISLAGHGANIHYRVQWFVPDNLQTNVFEKIYIDLQRNLTPPDLTTSEIVRLQALRAKKLSPTLAAVDPFKAKLRTTYHAALDADQQPVVLVILVESLRPSEVGIYSPGTISITPALDAFAQQGIWFRNAYSTGNVTRGAQEAVWCGLFASQNTSMMRNRPDLKIPCLPEATHGANFWHHGGHPDFDGQVNFWKQRGVNHLMSQDDFLPQDPRTDWGFSDLAMMKKSVTEIQLLRETMPPGAGALGMTLTVTNHIPWILPADAPPSLKEQALKMPHPSFATTAYSDYALGQYFEMLKAQGLWKDMIVVVASDHGITAPPLNAPKVPAEFLPSYLSSHIYLAIGGGLVEKALEGAQKPETTKVHDELVSQADVAPWLADLIGLTGMQFFGESLFDPRHAPVMVDLGPNVYSPQPATLLSRRELADLDSSGVNDERALILLQYRDFLHRANHGIFTLEGPIE